MPKGDKFLGYGEKQTAVCESIGQIGYRTKLSFLQEHTANRLKTMVLERKNKWIDWLKADIARIIAIPFTTENKETNTKRLVGLKEYLDTSLSGVTEIKTLIYPSDWISCGSVCVIRQRIAFNSGVSLDCRTYKSQPNRNMIRRFTFS